uniref:inorganic phosphate transporter n=1 Tax=Paraglaciecola sp. TaxID=1920173 RepID=UPI0030F4B36B
DSPDLLVFGMLSSLLAAGVWLFIASMMGWPVSTTHSIVGALVGFAAVGIDSDAVVWSKVGQIVASWVVSPVMAGTLSFGIFLSAQRLILNTQNPFESAKKYIPYYLFLVGFMISMVTMTKGLSHIGLGLNFQQCLGYSAIVGVIVAGIGQLFLRRIKDTPSADGRFRFASVERMFAVLMVFTACAMAFAHGSNDVANAIGPLAAVVSIVNSGGEIGSKSPLVWWILPLGGVGIVAGLALFGHRVIATIGNGITHLTPSRGFAAELAAASTVVIASGTGLPISTTQTLVGAVLGVGMARGIAALNLGVVRNIVISWVVTLPAGAGLSIMFFYMIKGIFAA